MQRRYLGIDVVTAAEQRTAAAFDLFDVPLVSVSGGKDSLVVLDLARREAVRRGRRLRAVHVDLEFLPSGVLRILDAIDADPGVDLTRVCPRLLYPRPYLDRWRPYYTWDRTRPHRPVPDGALTDAEVGDLHDGEASAMGDIIAGLVRRRYWPGSVVVLRGLRATESVGRLLTTGKAGGRPRRIASPRRRRKHAAANPIYDWRERDVARYLRHRRVDVPEHYRAIHVSGGSMRVGGEPNGLWAASTRTMDPDLADRILAAYPDWADEWRYGPTWPGRDPEPRHRASLRGVEALIAERYDPVFHPTMLRHLDEVYRVVRVRPTAYPPAYVARRAWHLTWHRPPPLHDDDPTTRYFLRDTAEAADQVAKIAEKRGRA